MDIKKIEEIILLALGESSALFMSKEEKGTRIVMPTEELIRISHEAIKDIKKILEE